MNYVQFAFTSVMLYIFCFAKGGCDTLHPYKFEGIFEEYRENRLDLLGKFLPNNPVIFEAGGHYGLDSARFAQKWPNATIISFEPNPHAFEKFKETTRSFPNVYGYNLAVNSYNGIATFYVCYGSTGDNPIFEGASSLLESSEWMKLNYQGPKIEVPCVILDDWCLLNDVDHFDFMWLDLEGFELQLLQSSPWILNTVKVIYTETNFQEFRKGMTQYSELRKFLEGKGFVLLAHWYMQNLQGDAIFIRKEALVNAFKN